MNSVDICNTALSRLGAEFIASIDGRSKNARLCKLHYEHLRRTLQETRRFAFCVHRQAWGDPTKSKISPQASTPDWGYEFSYKVPPGSKIVRAQAPDHGCQPYDYEDIEWVQDGIHLYCDYNPVWVTMVVDQTDPAEFSDMFIEVLVARMAAEMCIAITQSVNMYNSLQGMYKVKLQDAIDHDNQYSEGYWNRAKVVKRDSQLITARYRTRIYP